MVYSPIAIKDISNRQDITCRINNVRIPSALSALYILTRHNLKIDNHSRDAAAVDKHEDR
jgi:hypothetical protein